MICVNCPRLVCKMTDQKSNQLRFNTTNLGFNYVLIPWYLNVEESSRCHGVVVHIRIISDDHMTSHLDFLGHIHKRE